MMNMNNRNFGFFEGRLLTDPQYYLTGQGSEIVFLKLGCRRNYVAKGEEEARSDFVEFRGIIPKNTLSHGIYNLMHQGDLISIMYTLQSGCSEKDGVKTYYQSPLISQVELKEGKKIREARLAERTATVKKKK